MYKICVFAGTTEGRSLVEFLACTPVQVTACVATEYGEALLSPSDSLTICSGRMTQPEMELFFTRESFDLVVDATHPYAQIVTENLVAGCQNTHTSYLRLLREAGALPADCVFFPDLPAAAAYLSQTQGHILLTTGSKELAAFSCIPDFADRVYARVLPMEDSLRLCREAGLSPAHIFAMQGPFSMEMNIAMMKAAGADFLVTKESGKAGGFDEKITAARAANARLVVIGRPPQQQGLCLENTISELCRRFHLLPVPQVSILGIGPGAKEYMTANAASALQNAQCVIGASRMTDAVSCSHLPVFHAIAPKDIAEIILTHPQYQRFAVVMSGDTGFYSGTRKLLPLLKHCRTEVLPGISSLSYFCAKLGISYEDITPVSLHGRERNILSDLRHHRRIFTLVGGENGAGNLCRFLTDSGFGDVRISVGQHLSYGDESIVTGTAQTFAERTFDDLSVVLIENDLPEPVVTHGLPDSAFLRNGENQAVVPMTKQEVRSVCLSKLALTESSICWDVGAGTGSCSIEMALQASSGHVYAVEKKEDALNLLRENLQKFAPGNLTVVQGSAPEVCLDLPAPTHAFIGGSSGNIREIIKVLLAKNPDVRIVATAIALESVAELTACMADFDYAEAVSICAARDRKAGTYHLMSGLNPIFIFTFQGGGHP